MAHYFTREEAEALLPSITVVLRTIQENRQEIRALEAQLEELQQRAMGNGHHLYERILKLQKEIIAQVQTLRTALAELQAFGCELKDPDTGLIDFLSLRDGEEVYLCWRLGEERISYWHYLDTGFAGRQPL
ncbi:MAG TPA: DUF2203 domain-containing protein [Ktedonosporobacter sp.]|jgi:hypothetical protein|nr:DUF2203 domain-containing protein [Ktedonosporobacter sp.]